MIKKIYLLIIILTLVLFACNDENTSEFGKIAKVADGWHGNVIASIDQSYAGWDIEIGDADNDEKMRFS